MINWVQTKGNYCQVVDGVIKYVPPVIEEDFDALTPQVVASKYISQIKSSIFFESGNIEFTFKVNDPAAIVTVVLGDLSIGTNSFFSSHLYSIRKSSLGVLPESLCGEGKKGTLDVGGEYKFSINIDGSNIIFYINGVVVCRANSTLSRDQIAITFFSKAPIEIRNFSTISVRPKAFVVMQFTDEYNALYKDVIKPVTESFGYHCIRADEFHHGNLILTDIIESIKEASVIIADITPDNPNVFYEVGYAHALAKPTILLSDKRREKLPFDVSGFRTLFYDNSIGGKNKVEESLKKHLEHLNK
jgi:nucleoside 2-deoxyribosyltransferase